MGFEQLLPGQSTFVEKAKLTCSPLQTTLEKSNKSNWIWRNKTNICYHELIGLTNKDCKNLSHREIFDEVIELADKTNLDNYIHYFKVYYARKKLYNFESSEAFFQDI